MTETLVIDGLEVLSFDDGVLKTSVAVSSMEQQEAIAITGAADDGSLLIPVNNFLFRRGNSTVLIDAGAADSMQPTLGKLPEKLRGGGIDPAAITHILLTHLHPDHANGLIDQNDQAVFPNAELVLHEVEHAFWTSAVRDEDPEPVKRNKIRSQRNLAPYRDRTQLVWDDTEILGCKPILAPGHTPGHTCWLITTDDRPIMAWGDLVHFSDIQVAHPDVSVTFDVDPGKARDTRLRMLERIANDNLIIAGAHVLRPGFARVTRSNHGFRLESLHAGSASMTNIQDTL